jgi:LacI family transcriptional regulator, repressor for deo operon, udp, cdd, tsx, nupC, and nupG
MQYVGVAVPFTERWYFDAVLDGAAAKAREHGADLRIEVHPPAPQAHREVAESFRRLFADPDCVGAMSIVFEIDAEDVRVAADGRPVVIVGGRSDGLPSVFIDDVATARLATEYLLSLGHTRIAHLAGYATAPDDFAMRGDRVRGYSEAMRAAGHDELSRVVPSGFGYDDAHRVALRLLSDDDRPSAVFAVADEVAFAVLDAARQLGLEVPRQLSVLGVDDHADAAGRGLSTMRQDPRSLGAAAIARVFGETRDDEQRLDVELIARSSTGAPEGVAPTERTGALGRLLGARLRRRG